MLAGPPAPHHTNDEGRTVTDMHLQNAAHALSAAIGNRWGGWYQVGVGDGCIRVSYDRDHAPALATGREYNGYPVHLHPTATPAAG